MHAIPVAPQSTGDHVLALDVHAQVGADVVVEGGDKARTHRAHVGVKGHVLGQGVGGIAEEARIDAARELVAIAQQLLHELALGDAEIGAQPENRRGAGVGRQLLSHPLALGVTGAGALDQHGQVIGNRELVHFRQEGLEVGRLVGQRIVEPGGGGIGGQGHRVAGDQVGHPDTATAGRIHVGRDQHHAIEADVVAGQQIEADSTGAHATVALTENVLRRCPAIVLGNVLGNEVRHRLDVIVYAPEVLAFRLAQRAGEAGTDRIHHHQVDLVDDAVLVVLALERPLAIDGQVLDHSNLRPQHPHVQPHGG